MDFLTAEDDYTNVSEEKDVLIIKLILIYGKTP